jgi:hypothetical protein
MIGLTERGDLVDRLKAVLPPAEASGETARRVVEVMAEIAGASHAAAFRERAGMVRLLAGDRPSDRTIAAIKAALRTRRGAGRAPIPIVAPPIGAGGRGGSWVFWSGRPHDAELDVVYFEGPRLRAHADCSPRLARLAALLGELP